MVIFVVLTRVCFELNCMWKNCPDNIDKHYEPPPPSYIYYISQHLYLWMEPTVSSGEQGLRPLDSSPVHHKATYEDNHAQLLVNLYRTINLIRHVFGM